MTMTLPDIIIQEVAPRDGLQIEPAWVQTEDKIRLIDALSDAGFRRIEVTSFVSPKAVPALRDAGEVFTSIHRREDTVYVALVPNTRGAEGALAAQADELNFVISASETHNRANMRMGRNASFAALEEVSALTRDAGARLNATVATAFGCPFEGPQAEDKIVDTVRRYLDMGAHGITLADTTGMANPVQVSRLVTRALSIVPAAELTLHFHNTRGLGLLNVSAAMNAGAKRFDSSLGGLGGCPFAPGASGNVCTEDLVNLCEEIGLSTQIDLRALLNLSRGLAPIVGHETYGQVAKAGLASDLHIAPSNCI